MTYSISRDQNSQHLSSYFRNRTWRRLAATFKSEIAPFAHSDVEVGLRQIEDLYHIIPTASRLNQALNKFKWSLIEVAGFLPPKEYLNHIRNRRLPVDTSIRENGHAEFCAAPDLFHEVFGHIGLLSNPVYSSFVQEWGIASCKAFQSVGEKEYYQTIRRQTMVSADNIGAQNQHSIHIDSEATKLARLGWWTVECGLFKQAKGFEPYGAAVLSSLTEFLNSQKAPVRKASVRMFETQFDPTTVQKEYFYIESFSDLFELLDLATKEMAFRKGGIESLEVAKASGEEAVIEFCSGKSLRGVISRYDRKADHLIVWLQGRVGGESMTIGESHKFPILDKIKSVYPAHFDSESK